MLQVISINNTTRWHLEESFLWNCTYFLKQHSTRDVYGLLSTFLPKGHTWLLPRPSVMVESKLLIWFSLLNWILVYSRNLLFISASFMVLALQTNKQIWLAICKLLLLRKQNNFNKKGQVEAGRLMGSKKAFADIALMLSVSWDPTNIAL